MLGMRIRVTEAILLIAFLIMAVCMGGWKKQLLFCVLPFLLMCGMTWTLTGAVRNHYADFDSSDKEFPPVHFVMMGVGEDGTYKKQDVEFTEAISGEKEKTRADIHEMEKRIREVQDCSRLPAEKCGSPGRMDPVVSSQNGCIH